MDKKNLAFDKMNFILLAIGMAIVIICPLNRNFDGAIIIGMVKP